MKIGIKVSSNDNNCTVEINGFLIPLLVTAILVGIIVVVTLCLLKSMDFKYIVFAAIFMVTAVTLSLLAFEVSKPFVKMAFLKEIINKNIDKEYLESLKNMELRDLVKEELANQRDLIKKYCDTLADL